MITARYTTPARCTHRAVVQDTLRAAGGQRTLKAGNNTSNIPAQKPRPAAGLFTFLYFCRGGAGARSAAVSGPPLRERQVSGACRRGPISSQLNAVQTGPASARQGGTRLLPPSGSWPGVDDALARTARFRWQELDSGTRGCGISKQEPPDSDRRRFLVTKVEL